MEKIILDTLTQLGLGVAGNAVYGLLISFFGKSVEKTQIISSLEQIEALKGKVDMVYEALKAQSIFHEKSNYVEVSGVHNASGHGLVIGLDVQGQAKIRSGTVVNASGTGTIIGTRVGGSK